MIFFEGLVTGMVALGLLGVFIISGHLHRLANAIEAWNLHSGIADGPVVPAVEMEIRATANAHAWISEGGLFDPRWAFETPFPLILRYVREHELVDDDKLAAIVGGP